MMEDKKIGLVLSGRGFKGVTHIGAIQAMEAVGIYPQFISGTSAGSFVGALYTAGYSVLEIRDFFKNTPLFSFSKFAIRKAGFLDSEKFGHDLFCYFPENSFGALQKTLYVTATNVQ